MMNEHLGEQELVRREKLEELKKMGIDPFGHAFKRTHHTKEIFDKYEH